MSAARAGVLPGCLSKILVDGEKERPEAGGARQIVIHRRVLRGWVDNLRSTPLGELDPVIRLFEGNFLGRIRKRAQDRRISHRLPRPRTATYTGLDTLHDVEGEIA